MRERFILTDKRAGRDILRCRHFQKVADRLAELGFQSQIGSVIPALDAGPESNSSILLANVNGYFQLTRIRK